MKRVACMQLLLALLCVGCKSCRPTDSHRDREGGPPASALSLPTRPPMPRGFLKGQLHAHTSRSADSDTSPQDVHSFYEAHGYDFVVFTDHNAVTDTDDTRLLTIRGAELTRSMAECEPPPLPGKACLLHMNVLFASSALGPVALADLTTRSRREVYGQELKRAQELGGVAMLNHPNMQYGADEAIITELAQQGLALLEIGNQSWDADNAGDATHPSTEAIWDAVLSRGAHVFAAVTDDAHFYGDPAAAQARGERPFPGDLGFVVVRAEKNEKSIRDAVVRGDFYGSTGVLFETYELSRTKVVLATTDAAPVLFETIGRGGAVLQRVRGSRLELTPGAAERPYVRIRVTRDDGAGAWTQPVFR